MHLLNNMMFILVINLFFQECELHRTRYEENNKLNGKLEQEISTLRDNCRDFQQNISTLEVCFYFDLIYFVKNKYINRLLYKFIYLPLS